MAEAKHSRAPKERLLSERWALLQRCVDALLDFEEVALFPTCRDFFLAALSTDEL